MEKKIERKVVNKIVSEGHLDFLEKLHREGYPLKNDQLEILTRGGRLSVKDQDLDIISIKDHVDKNELPASGNKSIQEHEADKYVVIVDEDDLEKRWDKKPVSIAEHEAYDKLQEGSLFHYHTEKEITKADWMPSSVTDHTQEFVLWINSINAGFQGMIKYDKFRKYCQQAKNWIDEPRTPDSRMDRDTLIEHRKNEIRRCKTNTLYFLDRYLMLKEGDNKTGDMKYLSKPAHKVICYLMDCKYSLMVGKGRQMAASSTFGGCALAKILFNRNFFLKFIAQDDVKGKEIFNDKIKYPFTQLPTWMMPTVANDPESRIRFRAKGKRKGEKKGLNSEIHVVPPSVGAINGGSPQCVFIDEAGYIGMLGKMIKEARPTMFKVNEETGKLDHTRQIVIWGTGGTEDGEVKRKTKSYEVEYLDCADHWEKKDFHYGIVPIFFDWTARPGITKKMYLQEKRSYTKEGPEKEASLIQFRQHYPSTIKDMFLTTGKLLVDATWISEQMDKIREAKALYKTKKGYFEPIYDTSSPTTEGSDVPFKIIGATFIPLDDTIDEMSRASVEIFVEPDKVWRNRYYQGTDPIANDTGYSNMSSAIFDAHFNTISAVVNFRVSDVKYTFLQCMLLGVYYNTDPSKVSVPELLESNIGTSYAHYKEAKGNKFAKSLVHRKELMDHLQGGGSVIGIDNKGNRATAIINKMHDLVKSYGTKIYIMDFFRQLETFTCTVSQKGAVTWGVSDKRQFQDDVLYSCVFAYICKESFSHRAPYSVGSNIDRYKVMNKLVRSSDGTLSRVPTRVKVKN